MMTVRKRVKKASPILTMAAGMVEDASTHFIGSDSKFKHTFEARLDQITADPEQPRKAFDQKALDELAATMTEHGQLQPILVRKNPLGNPKWVIVAGERRWRAAGHAQWSTILAIEFDGDSEVASLIENLQRVDLSPHEEARGLKRLLETRGLSQAEAAETLGKTKGEISATLRLLSLGEDCLVRLSEHGVPKNVLVELARITDDNLRNTLIDQAENGKLTVKEVRYARERPEMVVSPALKPPRYSNSLSLKALEKISSRLVSFRAQRSKISANERDKLLALRTEIDETLARLPIDEENTSS